MASTMPNMVSVLMREAEAPTAPPNVPSSTTGTAMVGISVARQFCRNRNITRNTSTMASTRVLTTSSIEMLDEGRGVVGDTSPDARREVARELVDARP